MVYGVYLYVIYYVLCYLLSHILYCLETFVYMNGNSTFSILEKVLKIPQPTALD